ncbi:MAG: hypothetical protein GMKNLPBB_00098 [Myxococcota bacterium]|nr:hypothetical protein [Myxococcota bacterium]
MGGRQLMNACGADICLQRPAGMDGTAVHGHEGWAETYARPGDCSPVNSGAIPGSGNRYERLKSNRLRHVWALVGVLGLAACHSPESFCEDRAALFCGRLAECSQVTATASDYVPFDRDGCFQSERASCQARKEAGFPYAGGAAASCLDYTTTASCPDLKLGTHGVCEQVFRGPSEAENLCYMASDRLCREAFYGTCFSRPERDVLGSNIAECRQGRLKPCLDLLKNAGPGKPYRVDDGRAQRCNQSLLTAGALNCDQVRSGASGDCVLVIEPADPWERYCQTRAWIICSRVFGESCMPVDSRKAVAESYPGCTGLLVGACGSQPANWDAAKSGRCLDQTRAAACTVIRDGVLPCIGGSGSACEAWKSAAPDCF